MSVEVNEIINGLYGYVYDENGKQMETTQEFEAGVDVQKQAIKVPGKFLESHKVMGGSGSGSMMFQKMDSVLQKKISDDPTAKFNYIGKLADPTAKGEEAILFIGVNFDNIPLMGYKLGEVVEVELDFTFDDYRYLQTID